MPRTNKRSVADDARDFSALIDSMTIEALYSFRDTATGWKRQVLESAIYNRIQGREQGGGITERPCNSRSRRWWSAARSTRHNEGR